MRKLFFPWKKNFLRTLGIILSLFVLIVPYTPVYALSDDREAEFRANDILFYDGGDYACAPSGGKNINPGNIYMIGDSITHGAEKNLKEKFTSPWKMDDNHINGKDSRSVAVADDVINADAAYVADSVAIVIALGTNNAEQDISSHIKDAVAAVRNYNKTAPIFWVDIAITRFDPTNANSAIYDLIESDRIVPWFKTIFPDSNPTSASDVVGTTNEYLRDNVHPTSDGMDLFAQTIYDWVSKYQMPSSASDMNLTGDNVARAFAFFIQKGFSNEQAAGILGNLAGESGLNPENVQDSYNRREGIEDGEYNPLDLWWWGTDDDGNKVRRDAGYGIAQWTSRSRKERFSALAEFLGPDEDGNIYGSLDNQLDLVWYELTGEPAVPGVTGGNYGFVYDHLTATTTIEEATISWVQKYERPQSLIDNESKGYDFLVELYRDDRIKHAEEIYEKYAGKFSGGTGCEGSNADAFISTITAYAWPNIVPNNSIATHPAKDEYTEAIKVAKTNNEYTGGGNAYGGGIDCGAFVTRVLRDSGFDPKYNSDVGGWGSMGGGATTYQKDYLDANWRAIEVNDTSDLLPGDVAMQVYDRSHDSGASGHTFLFIGTVAGFETNVASSSLDSRAPAAGHENIMNPNYVWYRRI